LATYAGILGFVALIAASRPDLRKRFALWFANGIDEDAADLEARAAEKRKRAAQLRGDK
jgi:hypothetical protein